MTIHADIDDNEFLWRRIHPDHILQNGRVSSAAFSSFEMSVDIASIQQSRSITMKDGAGIAKIKCVEARELGQEVVRDPILENSAHALIRGKKTKRVKRALRDKAQFVTRDDIISNL